MARSPTEVQRIVDRVWTRVQNSIHAAYQADKPPVDDDLDLLTVCQEAMAARHTDGRRYFDMAVEAGLLDEPS